MIKMPIFFGVICKKTDTSLNAISRERDIAKRLCKELGIDEDRRSFDEDEQLAGWSCGMSDFHLGFNVEGLVKEGLVENIDFIVTTGGSHRNMKMKVDWLSYDYDTNCVSWCEKQEGLFSRMIARFK